MMCLMAQAGQRPRLHHGVPHEPQGAPPDEAEQVAGRHRQHVPEPWAAPLRRLYHPRQPLLLEPVWAHRPAKSAHMRTVRQQQQDCRLRLNARAGQGLYIKMY